MPAIAKLIRHTPADDLKAYFASRSAEFLGPVEWSAPKNLVLKQVWVSARTLIPSSWRRCSGQNHAPCHASGRRASRKARAS